MKRNTSQINSIIVHCSANIEGSSYGLEYINDEHKKRFPKGEISGLYCGYHFIVLEDGSVVKGRDLREVGCHTKGFNLNSIGICYIGGLDKKGKPKDTRTYEQKESLRRLIVELSYQCDIETIEGHRDKSPDTNHDGIITPNEWLKSCPCFDAIPEYADILEGL
jgi:N-acetyl-anhydromuramyl-L-alanine amidase AmpD